MDWNEEAVMTLKHLWETTKMSATEIGKVLGCGKGAVIGKARRMDFVKLYRNNSGRPSTYRKRKEPAPVAAPEPAPIPVLEKRVQYGKCDLLNLHAKSCRWPVEPGWYCGELMERGSYCEEHAKLAYVAPRTYQRQSMVKTGHW